MLILPFESRLDWRQPPFLTILLLLANVVVHFLTGDANERAIDEATRRYVATGLIVHENALFRQFFDREGGGAELPEDDRLLAPLIVTNRAFDREVERALQGEEATEAVRQWQRARARVEAARDHAPLYRFGLVPEESRPLSFVTSMFMHGGIGHLLGNMVFLFIFGFALERVLGALSYGVLYLVTGVAGGLAHVAMDSSSLVPMVGASGAVSGLMGAYVAVYRLRRIRFFYSLLFYFGEFRAPALVILPFWIGVELYGYFFAESNVAYWAHIGGLGAGAMLLLLRGLLVASSRDDAYLNERGHADRLAQHHDALNVLLDEFKFEQARQLAARWLASEPDDLANLSKYVRLLESRPTDPDYHKTVAHVFGLAPRVTDPQVATLVRETYEKYVEGSHKKLALQSVARVCALAKHFAQRGNLDYSGRLLGALLKAERQDAEVGYLVNLLRKKCLEAGDQKAADRYQAVLRQRFPDVA